MIWLLSFAFSGPCPDGRVESLEALPLLAVHRSPVCAWPGTVRDGVFASLPEDERLQQAGWVAARQHGDRIVGILDSKVEAPGWEILVAHSQDAGQSWTIGPVLRKPYYMARLDAFELDEAGRGRLTLSLDDDYGSGQPTGRYLATTDDGGRSFTAFELQKR